MKHVARETKQGVSQAENGLKGRGRRNRCGMQRGDGTGAGRVGEGKGVKVEWSS